jgi:hypothetical protein
MTKITGMDLQTIEVPVLKLKKISINGDSILAYREMKDSSKITVFPYWRHFTKSNILELERNEFNHLVESHIVALAEARDSVIEKMKKVSSYSLESIEDNDISIAFFEVLHEHFQGSLLVFLDVFENDALTIMDELYHRVCKENLSEKGMLLYSYTKTDYNETLEQISPTCVSPLIEIRKVVKSAMYQFCENNGKSVEEEFSHNDFRAVCNKIYNEKIKKTL